MDYTISAIKTRYGGVVFRSRLEAKWAAMFDLVGWRWTYEPRDFNGWIPDFVVHASRDIYVEVKPVRDFPAEVAGKLERSGCDDRMMIVGDCVPLFGHTSLFGWYCHPDSGFEVVGFSTADEQCFPGSRFGFMDQHGDHADSGEVLALWREAGNRTRWNPSARSTQ